MRSISVKAPSNIALVKYMGKDDARINLPANASLSLTLDALCTYAEVRKIESAGTGPESRWVAEMPAGVPASLPYPAQVPALSDEGARRATQYADRALHEAEAILSRHGLAVGPETALELRTASTFPMGAGIASSASSFAAITLAAVAARAADLDVFRSASRSSPELRRDIASLSRQGSGSSCRSFEGPWVLWQGESATRVPAKLPELSDFVLLIEREPKKISSSRAHGMVRTSPLWEKRVDRVGARIARMLTALASGDLELAARTAWSEMWEMHSLFHTCAEPFTYWEPGSVRALKWLEPYVQAGAVVTMDAGANVHVLVPTSEAPQWRERLRAEGFDFLEDRQGGGAVLL